jgi:hypothetical protein
MVMSACRCRQARPGPALEVVGAQPLLRLPVGLLARPARLDRGCELPQVRASGQVGEVVLPLARGSALADRPDLLAGQVPAVAELRAFGGPHPPGGELGPERPLGPPAPADPAPRGVLENGPDRDRDRDRGLARDRVLAGPPGARHRPKRLDLGRVSGRPGS